MWVLHGLGADGSVLSYSLFWYGKDEGGRMKDESEGPAFELRAENSDHGPDWIDGETADDLECWLAVFSSSRRTR